MCGFVLLSFLLSDLLRRKKIRQDVLALLAYLGAAVGVVALLGGFSHNHMPDTSQFGQSSFNLNGLWNPQGWSQYLSDLPVYGANPSEGLAFPGTGIVLTLIVAAAACLIHTIYKVFIKKEKKLTHLRFDWGENGVAFLILAMISLSVALSPQAACGSSLIWNYELPAWLSSLWQRISCCGRFIWPVLYLIILGSVVWMEKEMPWETMAAVLLVIFAVLQIADGKWQLMQRQVQFGTEFAYDSRLEDEKWDTWAREGDKKHMVFVGLDDEDLLNDLSAYAAENGMTINYFNTACQTIRTKAVEDLVESLINPREDTMYIYKAADEGNCIDTRMEYDAVDGVIVGMVKKQG